MQIEKKIYLLGLIILLSNGIIETRAQLDVKNGPVEIFYPNGQVSSKGFVKDGKPDGYWISYYPTGVLKSEGKRSEYLLDSTWSFYNQAGELTEEINYKNGKRSGYNVKYSYSNPNLPGKRTIISKELYINDFKEGYSYYYYPTGEIKKIEFYTKGKKEGYSKEFNRDSIITRLIQYKDNYMISSERINWMDSTGLKQGTHKSFYEDGKVKEEKNYLNDVLHGYYREYNKEGKLMQTLRYEHGAIVEEIDEEAKEVIDLKRTFDEEGRIIFSGGYRNGVPLGIHRMYDTTGAVIKSIMYDEMGNKVGEGIIDMEGKKRGKWTDYFVSGKTKAEGNYSNNRRNGEWNFYFENGKIEQKGKFLNGRLEGEWTWYYPTGKIWRVEKYFNGEEDGYSVEYSAEGEIITEGNYLNGEKDGEWFYKVGDHSEKGNYIFGLRNDKWYYYYENGTLQFEGNYKQGNPNGRQIYYYEDGKIKEEKYYKNGMRERTWTKYNEEGDILLTVTYKNDKEIKINGIRIKLPENDIKRIS